MYIKFLQVVPETNMWGGILVCIAIVFAAFVLLWGMLQLLGLLNLRKAKFKADRLNNNAENKIVVEHILPIIDEESEEDDEELIAVITAAIAMVWDKPASGFRVVSFKKRTGWKLM